MMDALLHEVRAWIADDPDPRTADELTTLLERAEGEGFEASERAAARADLADRFSGMLQFGTAGLRGEIGSGPARMNRAVVIRAAAGLCAYLRDTLRQAPLVVIGFDGRHGSRTFAQDTADVVAAAGGRALLMPDLLPTPLLAFAVRHLEADAGVMVTASHNPPRDNGYKVYLGGRAVTDSGQGAQIVPPMDAQIAERIAAVASVASVPRSPAQAERSGGSQEVLTDQIVDAYVSRTLRLAPPGGDAAARERAGLRVVTTAMHGVGGATLAQVLARAGFTDVTPTVAFPNPEEPGALDLAIAEARQVGADLIIANDPDADRVSFAVPLDGRWRQLTGDEVGSVLGQRVASQAAPTAQGAVLASSIVSSRLLGAIAAEHGLSHRSTLTGFKWISRVPGLVFGYEEALGYCVDPGSVRDKDGISAGLVLAAYAAELKAAGRSLPDVLDDLARTHGVYATAPLAVRVDDLSLIPAAMARLRADPPHELAGSPVVTARDLAEGSEDLPPTDGLLYLTASSDRVIVRPSGTEPKIKCYLESIVPVADESERALATARAEAADRLARLKGDIAAAAGI